MRSDSSRFAFVWARCALAVSVVIASHAIKLLRSVTGTLRTKVTT
jgi:hypothetical protein